VNDNGWPAPDVLLLLALAVVDEHFAQAHALGITGIPTYILDDKYAIVGAQPYEVFQQALLRLAAGADNRVGE